MKVIDLLNKIAKGEEVPKEIYYKKQWWKYNPKNDYEGTDWGGCFLNNVLICELNDEVEILDEEDEFIDIEEIYSNTTSSLDVCETFDLLEEKINEVIKNQKKIINKLKEEGK